MKWIKKIIASDNKNTKMYVNGVTFYLIIRMLFEGVSSSPMVSDES